MNKEHAVGLSAMLHGGCTYDTTRLGCGCGTGPVVGSVDYYDNDYFPLVNVAHVEGRVKCFFW